MLLNSGFFKTRQAVLVGLRQGKILVNGRTQKQYMSSLRSGDFIFMKDHLFRFFENSPICMSSVVALPGVSAFIFLGFYGTLFFPSPRQRFFIFPKQGVLHKPRSVFQSQIIKLFKKVKLLKKAKLFKKARY